MEKIFLTPMEMNVLSLLAEGKTIPSVALLTKKTYKTIDSHFYHLAQKCDIPPGNRYRVRAMYIASPERFEGINLAQKAKKERDINIYQLHKLGLSAKEIARRMNLSEQTIHALFRRIRISN